MSLCSTPYFLRQGLPSNPVLTDSAGLWLAKPQSSPPVSTSLSLGLQTRVGDYIVASVTILAFYLSMSAH